MKKSILILILIISMSLIGCSSGKIEETPETIAEEKANDEVETKDEEIPINPEDIMPEITILEPDSIGTVYMEAT
ncbi:MAG: hypothetical protein GX320_01030, partial [Tissierellia bacterium]|nr:hypothetical protein [Tissierellia bacterium]